MASFIPSSILNSLALLCLLCSLCSGFASKGEETGKCNPSSFLNFKGNENVTYLSLAHKYADHPEMVLGTTGSNYFVKVCLGGQELNLSFDTGSVLTWTQCNCKKSDSLCYYQLDESFDRYSDNFKIRPCSEGCPSSPGVKSICSIDAKCKEHFPVEDGECLYNTEYGDDSSTSGVLGNATLNIGNLDRKFLFGCGNKNKGLFSNLEDGVLGLGYDKEGKLSIVGQTEDTYHKKFSYCISQDKDVDNDMHGFLRFGHVSNPQETEKVGTEDGWEERYVLKLKEMKVKDSLVDESRDIFLVVDSGTTFTRLPSGLFNKLKGRFKTAMEDMGHKKENNDWLKPHDLKDFDECYLIKETPEIPFEAPVIIFQFATTSVNLAIKGTTVRSDKYACLAFVKDMKLGRVMIWGSYQQKGIEMNFDVGERKMWFNTPHDCKPKSLGGNNVPL